MELQQFYYDNKIVKKFIYATIVWGIVGMLIGLLLAFLFLFPTWFEGFSWLSFGRLRPLHTNAVIFAFVGNAIFAGVYYSLQRLLKARMASDLLSNINFWGWQLIIVGAAITLPLGYTTSKEYAELEWPFDIAIALIWVAFGANMEKVNLPKGLIRYTSESEIEKKEKFKFTPRLKGYTAVLVILVGVLIGMLLIRNDVEANILRLSGQLYEKKPNNRISNVFTYKLINKTTDSIDQVHFKIRKYKGGTITPVTNSENFVIPKQGIAEGTLFIEIPKSQLKSGKNKITVEVYSDDKLIETTTVSFIGPSTYN